MGTGGLGPWAQGRQQGCALSDDHRLRPRGRQAQTPSPDTLPRHANSWAQALPGQCLLVLKGTLLGAEVHSALG